MLSSYLMPPWRDQLLYLLSVAFNVALQNHSISGKGGLEFHEQEE